MDSANSATQSERIAQCMREAEEAKAELKDYMLYSEQIEAELDRELAEAKLIIKRKDTEILMLKRERDKFQDEASRYKMESVNIEDKLSKELKRLRSENDRLTNDIRSLEQQNDDLERELRITAESFKDTEKLLNEELEVRALLTTELETKEDLKDHCQRLEDEIKDLKLDISVKDAKILSRHLSNRMKIHNSSCDSENYPCTNGFVGSSVTHSPVNAVRRDGLNRSNIHSGSKGSPSRISPVISNLVKTIQALEDRLVSLRPGRRSEPNVYSSRNRKDSAAPRPAY